MNSKLIARVLQFLTLSLTLIAIFEKQFPYILKIPIGATTIFLGFILPFLWNNYLWSCSKWNLNRVIGDLFGIETSPNLNGTWNGFFQSSFDLDSESGEYSKDYTCTLKINQTGNSIFIESFFNKSQSNSYFGQFHKINNQNKWFLVFGYNNDSTCPKLESSKNGGKHDGFCRLNINKDKLTGYYCNDANRKTYGTITLSKSKEV